MEQHRLEIAKDFGVDHTINIEEYNPEARVAEIMNLTSYRGSDVTIEATGVPAAVREGLRMTRDSGNYTIVGQYTDAGNVTLNPHLDLNKKHINVRGSWGSDLSHFYLAVKLVERYRDDYPFEQIISQEYSLEQINKALKDVENLRVMKAIIKPHQ